MAYRYNAITGELDLVMDGGSLGAITEIDTDSGSVLPAAGIVNLLGDSAQGVSTSGAGDTATITVADATESQKGVVELATDAEAIAGTDSTNLAIIPSSLAAKLGTQTQYGLAIGNTSSGAFNWTVAGTDGQIPIAATGGDPAFASLTSTGGTITFTPGTNTLNLEAGSTTATTYTTDSGNAIPSGNILNVLGGTLLGTTGAGNTVTVNADDNVVGSVSTDGSAATPTGNAFTLAGGTGITTSGAGATVTVDLDSPVTVANGGTGASTLTDHGVLIGSGTGAVSATAVGTSGEVLTSNGAGMDPTFQAVAAGGDVSGPASSTDRAIATWDGTGGDALFDNSSSTIDASGNLATTSISFDSGSNVLSVYETGSWTPVLSFGGASVGITYSTQTGSYTRIGNVVIWRMSIILTNKGSSTGNNLISGLPYSSAAAATAAPRVSAIAFSGYCTLQTSPTNLVLLDNISTMNTATLTDAAFVNNSIIIASGAYIV